MNALSRNAGWFAVLLFLRCVGAASAQTYQVSDLGLLNGSPTYATAINDNGVVCGYAQIDANTTKAWVSASPAIGMVQLLDLGGNDTRALAVGADGAVYGYGTDAGGVAHALMWPSSAVMVDLGAASATEGMIAQAVNAAGAIVGNTGTAATPVSAFKLSPAFTAIAPLAGATPPAASAAFGINDAGQIVGVSSWAGGGTRAFRTDAGGVAASLGTLGANDSTATAVNAVGDVVGYSVNAANATHAFIFTDGGGLRDLGVLTGHVESRASAVNDTGLVIGTSEDAAGNARAFLWNGSGALLDLNPLIAPNSGWVLQEALDINGGGDIVGNGTFNGVPHACIIERFTGLDTLAPVVIGSMPTPLNGYWTSAVTVNFWDNEKVVGDTTHAAGMIRITGPNGFNTYPTVQSWYGADRQSSTSTFVFTAPGGAWNGADNGTYEIRLAPDVVSDLAGNRHPGGVIGTFTVGLQTAPTLTLTGLPATATAGTPVNLTVTATGSYPAAAGDVFDVTIDWDGDGGDMQAVNAVTNTSIPHTFTTLGTHTVRVTVTDPNGITSSERTAQVAVSNALPPVISTALATQTSYFTSMSGVRLAEKAGTIYMFGGYPLSNDNTPVATWNYATPGEAFVFRGDLDNGPILPEGAGLDGRGRICIWGGVEAEGGGAKTNAMTYTIAGGVAGGMAAKPAANNPAVTARDNLGRLYSISANIAYRYDAGASGNGVWSTLAPPPGIVCNSACYDGTGRVIVFGGATVWAYGIAGNAWTQLPGSPATFTSAATLGADGFIYLVSAGTVYAFNPVTDTSAVIGRTNFDHTVFPAVLGADGLIYFPGGSSGAPGGGASIETIDTKASAAIAPRITSTPTGATSLAAGNAWTHTVIASGRPAPTFSVVSGPVGVSVDAITGAFTWTPTFAQAGTHTARVRAGNSAGFAEQLITLTVLGTPPDAVAPVPVTGLAAFNVTLTSVDLAWNATTDNIGVTAYRVMEKRTGGNRFHRTTYYYTLGTTTGFSWHLGGLPVGMVKTYYVAAIDAAGNQSAPTPITVALIAPPAVYANSSGTFLGRRVIVGEPWTGNVITAIGNPVPALTPAAFPSGAVWHSTAANTGYFTWTAVGGQEGAQTFTVNAANTGGSAGFSQPVTVYPAGTDLIPPGYVGSLTVDQVSYDSCRVTWTAAADNYGVVAYRVSAVHREGRRRFHHGPYNDHVVTLNVPATTTQVVIPGLRPSTGYMVSVNATDAAGLWGYSYTRDITTLLKPFIVEAAQATTTTNPDGSTTMTWPGYGYYWMFTVECSADLATWAPVEPAGQWPTYITTFTFTPEPGVPARFYRVKATPAATP